jgi:hypothetical protein
MKENHCKNEAQAPAAFSREGYSFLFSYQCFV